MTKQEKLNKILTRINNIPSNQFEDTFFITNRGRRITSYKFGEELGIDAYNGILRVRFRGEVVDYFHDNNDGKDKLYQLIRKTKEDKRQAVLMEL